MNIHWKAVEPHITVVANLGKLDNFLDLALSGVKRLRS